MVVVPIAFACATLLSLLVTWRALRARPRQGAGWLAATMAGVTWWSFMWLLQTVVSNREGLRMTFNALHWIGVGAVAVGVLGFGLALTGREEWLTRPRIVGLSVVPALATASWLADPRVVDLVASTARIPIAVAWALDTVASAWSWFEWVALLYLYGLAAVGSAFVLEAALERPKWAPDRVLLVVMIAVPGAVNVASELDAIPYPGFDPTVLGFVVTGLAGIAAIDRFRLFNVPFARSQLVEQLSTPVLVYGRDHRVYDYNEAAARLLDVGAEDVGADVRELLPRTMSVPTSEVERNGDLADAVDGTKVSVAGPDDRVRRFLVHVSPLASGPLEAIGYAVHLSDVTAQHRQRERLEQQNERLEEFANFVSHDLQSPLNAAMGRLELAREDCDCESDHLDQVARSHERMETLIDDVLALARQGTDVEETDVVDVGRVAESCWHAVEASGVELTVETEVRVRADPARLRQLLENLFRNAVEHGPDDGEIRVGRLPDGFYVADDGPGIPEEKRETVFEKRYTTSERGTGFGLAIVRTIASAHGWTVAVTESWAGGARFEITGAETA